MICSALRTALGTLVLALTVLLTAGMPAQAAPTAPPPTTSTQAAPKIPAPEGNYSLSAKTSKASKAQIARAKRFEKATSPAHTNKAGQIDYRWVKSSFGKYTDDRNGFAAGWWQRRKDWKQFTHISTADKKAVISWAKSHKGPNPKSTANTMVMRQMAPKPCTGTSAFFTVNSGPDKEWWSYLNSCDTDNAVIAATLCAPFIGIIGAIGGVLTAGVAAIPAAVGVFACVGNLIWLTTCRDNSTVRAVNIRVRDYGSLATGFKVPYTIFSQ